MKITLENTMRTTFVIKSKKYYGIPFSTVQPNVVCNFEKEMKLEYVLGLEEVSKRYLHSCFYFIFVIFF